MSTQYNLPIETKEQREVMRKILGNYLKDKKKVKAGNPVPKQPKKEKKIIETED